MRWRHWCVCLAGTGLAVLLSFGSVAAEEATMTFKITSPAFADNAAIPAKYTCEGEDVSPPLAWSGVPAGTKSLVLIVDDPDAPDPKAPQRTWVHWVLYDLPPTAAGLAEGGALACGSQRRSQRLEARWIRRSMSADRPASLLLQAVRARHGSCRFGCAHKGAGRSCHAGPRSGRSATSSGPTRRADSALRASFGERCWASCTRLSCAELVLW